MTKKVLVVNMICKVLLNKSGNSGNSFIYIFFLNY